MAQPSSSPSSSSNDVRQVNNNASQAVQNPTSASQIVQNNMKATPVNKKKAEFEKKIRKFIESDSPHKPVQSKKQKTDYSFDNDTLKTQGN
jgi:hypothetical protein